MGDHRLRNGRTVSLTSLDGVEHPEAFVCPNRIVIDPDDLHLEARIKVYHSKEAYDADASPVAGATETIELRGEECRQFIMSNPELSFMITEKIWQLAQSKGLLKGAKGIDEPTEQPSEPIE